jgi:hypothetical protein
VQAFNTDQNLRRDNVDVTYLFYVGLIIFSHVDEHAFIRLACWEDNFHNDDDTMYISLGPKVNSPKRRCIVVGNKSNSVLITDPLFNFDG